MFRSRHWVLLVEVILFIQLFRFSTAVLYSQSIKNITISEVLSIGSEESEELYQWAGIATDDAGFIYVSDAMDYSIKKFDPNGTLLLRVGRKGRGPGEFMAPRLLRYYGGRIYINDQFNPGLQVFAAKTLNYLNHIPFEKPIADFRLLSANQVAVSSVEFSPNDGCYIFVVDTLGTTKERLKFSKPDNSFMSNMVSFIFDKSNHAYFAFTWKDRIMKIKRADETKLWERSLFPNLSVEVQKVVEFEIPKHIVYKDIALDTLGNIFILGGYYSKNRSKDVYVLNKDGQHVATFALPEPSHTIHLDNHNNLYSRAGLGTILKKYAVRYEY